MIIENKKIVISVILISFTSGYFVSYFNLKSKQVEKEKALEIEIMKHQEDVSNFNEKLSSLQKNNITEEKTVYLNNGNKIVSKIIDNSIIDKKINTQSLVLKEYSDYGKSTFLEKETTKQSISSPSFLLGVSSFYHPTITGGVRVFKFPVYITISSKISDISLNSIDFGVFLTL